MKMIRLLCCALVLVTSSCVQQTHKRTITFMLDVSGIQNIKSVGLRGWDIPLSWDTDYPMQEMVKDSLYKVTITGETGRICTEFKFTVNGILELDGRDNRKVYFDTKNDTIKVSYVFDNQ